MGGVNPYLAPVQAHAPPTAAHACARPPLFAAPAPVCELWGEGGVQAEVPCTTPDDLHLGLAGVLAWIQGAQGAAPLDTGALVHVPGLDFTGMQPVMGGVWSNALPPPMPEEDDSNACEAVRALQQAWEGVLAGLMGGAPAPADVAPHVAQHTAPSVVQAGVCEGEVHSQLEGPASTPHQYDEGVRVDVGGGVCDQGVEGQEDVPGVCESLQIAQQDMRVGRAGRVEMWVRVLSLQRVWWSCQQWLVSLLSLPPHSAWVHCGDFSAACCARAPHPSLVMRVCLKCIMRVCLHSQPRPFPPASVRWGEHCGSGCGGAISGCCKWVVG